MPAKFVLMLLVATGVSVASFIWRHKELNYNANKITEIAASHDNSLVPDGCVTLLARYEYTTTDLIIVKNAVCNNGPEPFEWSLRERNKI